MSVLKLVTTGRVSLPHLLLIYGTDGVGKSTFASRAPNPIFIGPEHGTSSLDVSRLPTNSFEDVMGTLLALLTEKHSYKSVVIDSLDWLEPLVWQSVCKAEGWAGIETPGYGKGYVAAQKAWAELRDILRALRDEKKMNVILIAHSHVKLFQDPQTTAGYDRYQLKLNEKAAALFREFVDCVLFANFEVFAKTEKGATKAKAYGEGARYMYTERRPAFDAKNRFDLPFKLPLSWEDYVAACESKDAQKPEALVESIRAMMKEIDNQATLSNIETKLKEFAADPSQLRILKNKVAVAAGAAA